MSLIEVNFTNVLAIIDSKTAKKLNKDIITVFCILFSIIILTYRYSTFNLEKEIYE